MAAYHWYFVAAAYGITFAGSAAVLFLSWRRMVRAEKMVSEASDTPKAQRATVS
jgi:hypothetical protein